ncbi:hypothetical protein [Dysosmobacter sp.]|uniref:hypothetical protein n=1 Tax=Dysosmobacter sp. TaxID=2591382 RepID=UPI002A8AB039|nr:hypothetical protein [Dysosmobacter sp.]MDY3281609.1 PhnD/SsuA/transferrin family substrate-binding protein [Dysosmobacter sp.]
MRKTLWILLLAVLLTAGCSRQTAPAASSSGEIAPGASSSAPAEEPLAIGELTVELPREVDRKAARAALEGLPAAMAAEGVTVEAVSLTYGASHAAMAEAVGKGGVMLAILPAKELARFGGGAAVILGDAREGSETAGTMARVCAAPTEYGRTLAALAEKRPLTWQELDHARWGVLGVDSLGGYQCLELWLEDHYEGSGIGDLSSVTAYGGWEELLRAAAAGEIDLLPLTPEAEEAYAAAWTEETNRTAAGGLRGFGRSEALAEEVTALAETERLVSVAAAVTPHDAALNDPRFAEALCRALNRLCDGPAERKAALGAEWFAPLADSDLDGLRRLCFGT